MLPKKPVLIIQPGLAGDIVFCLKIAAVWAERGHRVVFPVEPRFADLRDALELPPGIEMPLTTERFEYAEAFQHLANMTESASAAGDFRYHQGPFELQDIIFLALASCWRRVPGHTMVLKYQVAGVEMRDWADYVRFKRDPERERRLLDQLGIHEGRDFVLVNEACSTRTIPLRVAGDVVRMQALPGFTLVDWLAVAERAREIVTVDTSLVLLVEAVGLQKPLHMVSRYAPPHFQPIEPLLRLNWRLALTPADLEPRLLASAPNPAPAARAAVGLPSETVVPLVFCFDAKFSRYAAATIASVLVNADCYHKIYCLFSGDMAQFPAEIEAVCRRFRCELVKVQVAPESYGAWKMPPSAHFSAAAYYRLLIPEVVAEDRVIYLDSDLIATRGLAELFAHDLGGAVLGGCLDPTERSQINIDIPREDPYLNSGVLLIDVAEFRRRWPPERIRQVYLENEAAILYPDQCLINKLAQGAKRVLPEVWNLQLHGRGLDYGASLVERYEGQAVIHFSGPVKPWMEWAPTPYRELWTRYAKLAGMDLEKVLIKPSTIPEWAYVAHRREAEKQWEAAAGTWRNLAMLLIENMKPVPA